MVLAVFALNKIIPTTDIPMVYPAYGMVPRHDGQGAGIVTAVSGVYMGVNFFFPPNLEIKRPPLRLLEQQTFIGNEFKLIVNSEQKRRQTAALFLNFLCRQKVIF
jgi:hypothetical protein